MLLIIEQWVDFSVTIMLVQFIEYHLLFNY